MCFCFWQQVRLKPTESQLRGINDKMKKFAQSKDNIVLYIHALIYRLGEHVI